MPGTDNSRKVIHIAVFKKDIFCQLYDIGLQS